MIELPEAYSKLLAGKRIDSTEGKGIFVDIKFDNKIFLSIFDGINMRYNESKTTIPKKYQMLGGYKSILSKNTYDLPCPLCGYGIVKEAYMGGSVYYCPECQKL